MLTRRDTLIDEADRLILALITRRERGNTPRTLHLEQLLAKAGRRLVRRMRICLWCDGAGCADCGETGRCDR